MSSRITRSAARQAAAAAAASPPADPPSSSSNTPQVVARPTAQLRPAKLKKRKSSARQSSPEASPDRLTASTPRRSKRLKVASSHQDTPLQSSSGAKPSQPLSPTLPPTSGRLTRGALARAMSSSKGPEVGQYNEPSTAVVSNPKKSKRKANQPTSRGSAVRRSNIRSRKSNLGHDADVAMADAIEKTDATEETGRSPADGEDEPVEQHLSDEDEEELMDREDDFDEDDNEDIEGLQAHRAHEGHGILSTPRLTPSQLRDILGNLKQRDDPSIQLIALQQLNQGLLTATEDDLSGIFSPDQFIKELVSLMGPDERGEENPEMMLLACRCISHLLEALPSSTPNLVYGGAVPVLCSKLFEIQYIEIAELALSTLEKISVEFPAFIVRAGGLTGCLTYLDFFATSTQRTAITTAANSCRNLPEDSFSVVRDAMPIILNVLGSSDQKVVEQAFLCVCRIAESFRYRADKLEELVSPDLLRAITRLLLPGTTNLIGPKVHIQLLRILSITARASPKLSVELFQMNIVDTLYQILTGFPPSGNSDVASEMENAVIVQAFRQRPRDQVFETLNVICELLPGYTKDPSMLGLHVPVTSHLTPSPSTAASTAKKAPVDKRLELLAGCREEIKRFAVILFPTLTDTCSNTVSLGVRQKVLSAQLQMLSNFDTSILDDALRGVSYASFLSSILSQKEHPTLVWSALQAAELLIERMPGIYHYQFYREGVIEGISRWADRTIVPKVEKDPESSSSVRVLPPPNEGTSQRMMRVRHSGEGDGMTESQDPDDDSMNSSDEEIEHDHEDVQEDMTASPGSSQEEQDTPVYSRRHQPVMTRPTDLEPYIIRQAKKFIETYDDVNKDYETRVGAGGILYKLRTLSLEMENHFLRNRYGNSISLFRRLASYFVGDLLETATSYELLESGIVETLVKLFSNRVVKAREEAQSAFLEVFIGSPIRHGNIFSSSRLPVTPFSAFVHKLQDLLSRTEQFELTSVQQSAADSGRDNPASMFSKMIYIKLIADEGAGIPGDSGSPLHLHAISTFKRLDFLLRSQIIEAEHKERSKEAKRREGALATFASAAGIPSPHHRLAEGRPATLGQSPGESLPTPATAPTPTSRKSTKTKSSNSTPVNPPAHPPVPTSAQGGPSAATRRSSRRHQPKSQAPPGMQGEARNSSAVLDCADEKPVVDQNQGPVDGRRAFDSILGALGESVDDEPPARASTVNRAVASNGKVPAKKEDGTRILTPSQVTASSSQSTSSLPVVASEASTPRSLNRHRSSAAAMHAVPQNFHFEFRTDDEPISHESTIYQTVVRKLKELGEPTYRNIWSAIHPIKYKRVEGRASSKQPTDISPESDSEMVSSKLPDSLDKNPMTSAILRLLKILHALNANLDDVLVENQAGKLLHAEPVALFVNTKLTAKLNRQLEEPIIVASKCLPKWSEDLTRLYPFLFPFETRHLFLQSTSFGYARAMARWQPAQSSNESTHDLDEDESMDVLKPHRLKLTIVRDHMLRSAIKYFDDSKYKDKAKARDISYSLEIEYHDEIGTGLGPTLEFYSTVSKDFSRKKNSMWRATESNSTDDYVFSKRGLFPAPMSRQQAEAESGQKVLRLFYVLGKFVARSMLDSRIIDIPFNPTFFRIGEGPATVTPSLGAVKAVDEGLAQSLKLLKQFANAKANVDEDDRLTAAGKERAAAEIEIQGARAEDLGLDFTLPGYPSIELQENGSDITVSIDNVGLYVDRVIDLTLGSGVQKQLDSFKRGFSTLFPYSALKAFTPDELVMLFGRAEENWSIETLMDSMKFDHGFNMDSKTIKNLLQIMTEFSPTDRRQFLQFMTGSPRLPIGGFKSLTPMFTVVIRRCDPPLTPDDYLPSVTTCQNFLKLPDYSNIEIMREKLNVAIREGQGAFHLS
ncbi:MAG: Ubiquitin fusion degradation protein 4 [Peltula sp. TS41687]|nr:MAG: Ubiquitin fusion degradation protein 4 [Peltula sp. TS41687]